MSIEIRKAERKKAKLRLGLAGPSGAGKTMSALKMAHGMGGRICLIDTERGSGDLYSDLFEYSVITLEPPYKPEKYVEAIKAAEDAGFDVIIIDSLSHAWADEGGLLDQADKLSAGGNRYTVWADLTPQHRKLVNGMLNSTKHIIATVRSKTAYEMQEYTDQKGNKKTKPVKLGLAPVQREGMEYEFTVFLDIDINHNASASKDRTNSFKDEIFVIDEKIGERVMTWLNSGKVDVNQLKRDLVAELNRLELYAPTEAADKVAFITEACAKLTGYELTDENLELIVQGLKTHQDKAKAREIMFGPQKPPEPPQPPTTPKIDPGAAGMPPASGNATGGGETPAAPVPSSQAQPKSTADKVMDTFGGEEVPLDPKLAPSWRAKAQACTTPEEGRALLHEMTEIGEKPMQLGLVRGVLVSKGLLETK